MSTSVAFVQYMFFPRWWLFCVVLTKWVKWGGFYLSRSISESLIKAQQEGVNGFKPWADNLKYFEDT